MYNLGSSRAESVQYLQQKVGALIEYGYSSFSGYIYPEKETKIHKFNVNCMKFKDRWFRISNHASIGVI